MKTDYDVVVIGGGTAGLIAAVQSGRAQASSKAMGQAAGQWGNSCFG